MVSARIFGREVRMQGSPWTFVEYAREFQGDLLSDFVDAGKRECIHLSDYLKFAWALCRTADPSTEGFEQWCRSFDEFTLAKGQGQEFLSVIDSVFVAELFRKPKTGPRFWWRRLRARWLGWVSRRRGAR